MCLKYEFHNSKTGLKGQNYLKMRNPSFKTHKNLPKP